MCYLRRRDEAVLMASSPFGRGLPSLVVVHGERGRGQAVGLLVRVLDVVAVPQPRAAEYHLPERAFEISHGERVDDGVHPRVDVPEPREHIE